ncbi:hypothetical protein LTR94_030086, partial [Friedmanniomyces endolithicus]
MDADAGFLEQFARDRFLDRLARFDEAGQRRIAAGRPGMLATEQDAPAIFGQHDDDGVGAGEMFGSAGVCIAFARPAGLDRAGGRAADRAMAMPGMPVDQTARGAVERDFIGRDEAGDGAAARCGGERRAKIGDQPGEDRPGGRIDAQQHMILHMGVGGERFQQQMAVHFHRLRPVEHQQAGGGIGE